MDKFDLISGAAEQTKVGSGTANVLAQQPAPGVGRQLVITGFSVSVGETPTASGFVDISRVGVGLVREFRLPIGVPIAPIVYEFKRPIFCGENEAASISVGSATSATLVIELYTVTRPWSGIVTPLRAI